MTSKPWRAKEVKDFSPEAMVWVVLGLGEIEQVKWDLGETTDDRRSELRNGKREMNGVVIATCDRLVT